MLYNNKILEVPEDIKHLSEWTDFYLPDYPCIINKPDYWLWFY